MGGGGFTSSMINSNRANRSQQRHGKGIFAQTQNGKTDDASYSLPEVSTSVRNHFAEQAKRERAQDKKQRLAITTGCLAVAYLLLRYLVAPVLL